MWQILFTPRARKDLLFLEKETTKRVVSKIEKSAEKPELLFERLVGFPYYKLRAGDYRIIAVLDFDKKIIGIRRIGNRENIYKKIQA